MTVTIEISDIDERRLREMAQRCGYDGVEQFVSDYIVELTRQDSGDNLAPMTPEELRASLAMIDESMAEIDAGLGISLEEARGRSLKSLRDRAG